MGRLGCWLLLVAVLSWLPACGSRSAMPLSQWVLVADGAGEAGEVPVVLPQHLDVHLPAAPTHYVLRTEVARDALPDGMLGLSIPHFEGLATLTVNGQPASPAQHEPIEGYRHAGPHLWHLPPLPPGRLGHPNAENGTAAKYRGSWGWCAGSRARRRRAQSPSEPAAGGTNLHERPRVRRAGTPAQGLGPQTQSAGSIRADRKSMLT